MDIIYTKLFLSKNRCQYRNPFFLLSSMQFDFLIKEIIILYQHYLTNTDIPMLQVKYCHAHKYSFTPTKLITCKLLVHFFSISNLMEIRPNRISQPTVEFSDISLGSRYFSKVIMCKE